MLIPNCLSVVGYNTNVQSLDDQMRATHALLNYIANKQLKVVLDNSFPLADAKAAHQAIQEKKTRGKVVLTVAE